MLNNAAVDEMRLVHGSIERYFADGLGLGTDAQTIAEARVHRLTTIIHLIDSTQERQ